jgi:putative membrane protein
MKMKKAPVNIWLLFMLLGSAFAVVSCETDDSDENSQRLTETDFVVRAANSDLFEIQTGQMASVKSDLTEVRDLGQHLVTDHTTSSTQLKNLAELKKITIPDSLSEDKRVHRMRLASETGTTFDKDFVNTQIMAHDEAISLYEQASRELQDPDLKNFATTTLNALHMHREHVVMVKAKTDAL